MSAKATAGARLSRTASRMTRECSSISRPSANPGPGRRRGQFGRGETPSLIFDLNPDYVRDVLLPELLQRHLETGGTLDYQVEVLTRQHPPLVIYQSDPGAHVAASADASVGLFDTPYDQIFRALAGTRAGADADPDAAVPGAIRDAGRCSCAIAPDRSKP